MGLTEADREMLRAATQRAKDRAARHGASCGVMVFSEGGGMSNSKERDAVDELAELREEIGRAHV